MESYQIIDWNKEAQAIIKDVRQFVNKIDLSKINLDSNQINRQQIFINLETKEGSQFTICLSATGLRICSKTFDRDDEQPETDIEGSVMMDGSEVFETIYALLSCKSPAYREAFAGALASKIVSISNDD